MGGSGIAAAGERPGCSPHCGASAPVPVALFDPDRHLGDQGPRFRRVIEVRVQRRFSDLDPLGHVNNVAYHDYLQEARVGLIGEVGLIVNPAYSQIVVSQEVRHVRPLHYGEEHAIVEVRLAHLARTSYTLAYRILDETGDLVAEASTRLAVVDSTTGRPIRLPEELRAMLTAGAADADAPDSA